MSLRLFSLIKFGKKKHIESLYRQGRVRFGAIEGFRNLNQPERGDKFEGALSVENDYVASINFSHPIIGEGNFIPSKSKLGSFYTIIDEPIFCSSLYSLTSENFNDANKHKICSRMNEFGEYAIVIQQPYEYLNLLYQKLNNKKLKFIDRLVKYKNLKKKGTHHIDLFTKNIELQHQFEYRFLVKNNCDSNEFFLNIGSLENISFMSSTIDLLNTTFSIKNRTKAK